jgi:hypothetical protein
MTVAHASAAGLSHSGTPTRWDKWTTGASHVLNNPGYINIVGNDSALVAARFQVARQVRILVGDSQSCQKPNASVDIAPNHLGVDMSGTATVNPWGHKIAYWLAGASGCQLTTNTSTSHAFYEMVANPTVGQGDLCEWSDGVMILNGVGINDCSNVQSGGTDLILGLQRQISLLCNAMGYILNLNNCSVEGTVQNGPSIVIIGLPPYLGPLTTPGWRAMVLAWNRIMRRLAYDCGILFYSPYNLVLGQYMTYIDQTNLPHYTATGSAAVAAAAVLAIQAGLTYAQNAA